MNLASSSSSTDLDGIDSMLDWFGVDKAVKDRLKERNTALTKEDITNYEDHPEAEALGSNPRPHKFKSSSLARPGRVSANLVSQIYF